MTAATGAGEAAGQLLGYAVVRTVPGRSWAGEMAGRLNGEWAGRYRFVAADVFGVGEDQL